MAAPPKMLCHLLFKIWTALFNYTTQNPQCLLITYIYCISPTCFGVTFIIIIGENFCALYLKFM